MKGELKQLEEKGEKELQIMLNSDGMKTCGTYTKEEKGKIFVWICCVVLSYGRRTTFSFPT